jgi:hypothetical protein
MTEKLCYVTKSLIVIIFMTVFCRGPVVSSTPSSSPIVVVVSFCVTCAETASLFVSPSSVVVVSCPAATAAAASVDVPLFVADTLNASTTAMSSLFWPVVVVVLGTDEAVVTGSRDNDSGCSPTLTSRLGLLWALKSWCDAVDVPFYKKIRLLIFLIIHNTNYSTMQNLNMTTDIFGADSNLTCKKLLIQTPGP